MATQQHQAGEAVGAGHVQIEKDKVPVGTLGETRLQLGDARRLHQAHLGAQAQGQGLEQGAAEQGVVIGNEDFI
ncbi:hypothetical protein D9M68_1002050 [compost metagenome]